MIDIYMFILTISIYICHRLSWIVSAGIFDAAIIQRAHEKKDGVAQHLLSYECQLVVVLINLYKYVAGRLILECVVSEIYIYLIETHIICVVISEYTTVSESTVVEVISPGGAKQVVGRSDNSQRV